MSQTFRERSYVICDSTNAQRRPTVKQNRLLLISHHISVLKRRRYFQTTYKDDSIGRRRRKKNLKRKGTFQMVSPITVLHRKTSVENLKFKIFNKVH
jgi:hypothetical protein